MGGEGELERLSQIRDAAGRAKAQGKTLRERRESVIATVAVGRIDAEPVAVQERAIHKYFEGEIGSPAIHGMVDGLHVRQPGEGEVVSLLRERLPQQSIEALTELYRQWMQSQEEGSVEPLAHPALAEAMKKVRGRFEEYIRFLVKQSARGCEGSWFLAKKSRMWADANRRSFFHRPRGALLDSGELVQTKEYPTSARAALYWVVHRVAEHSVGLDEEGKVKAPFVRLAIHGMVDTPQADIVLGGGNVKPGKEEKPASDRVLRWFAERLALKVMERGLRVPEQQGREGGSRSPIVAIHRLGDAEAELFTVGADNQLVARRVTRQGNSLSGAGIGLGHFRTGTTYELEDVSGKKRRLVFPGFGEEFHTVHVEICSSMRKNKANREALAGIFSELMVDFSGLPTLKGVSFKGGGGT